MLITIMLVIGSIFITIGYMDSLKPPSKIEYRYIPRSSYSYQMNPIPLRKTFHKMFNSRSAWSTYPYDHHSHSKKIKYATFVENRYHNY
jgi:hypothetical protein